MRKGSMTRWLSIIGIGAEGLAGLAPPARTLIATAAHVFGAPRHLALVADLISGEAHPWHTPIAEGIAAMRRYRPAPTVALASGDPFWFGVGSLIARSVPPAEFTCLPAPSCAAITCGRLGWSAPDCATVSLCGRPLETLRPHLHPGARLLLLSADAATPTTVAAYLTRHGFGPSRLHLLERLGAPDERIRAFAAASGPPPEIAALNMLAVEMEAGPDARIVSLASGLDDSLFEHDGQITKREIRAVTLSALAPRQGELLWDIGAGSGSIGIEWMLRHPANRTIAFEPRPDRAARIARNALALGTPGLVVVQGEAPAALAGAATPDAVFIGGGATDPGVLDAAWNALRPGGRIVANAIAFETGRVLAEAWEAHGGSMTRLSVERLDGIGTLHAFRPAMTVTQWSAVKP